MRNSKTLIAAAVLALMAGSVFAHNGDEEVAVSVDSSITNNINVSGDVSVSGDIGVETESGAVVGNEQKTHDNGPAQGDPTATVGGSALEEATGNIGVNVTAGAGNLQANDAAISQLSNDDMFVWAQVTSHQKTYENTDGNDASNTASLGDSALSEASGNIGVNISAGIGNVQENGMALSVNSEGGNLVKAVATNDQTAHDNSLGEGSTNVATLSGEALSGASGNIGVNIAAGVGNAQHNGLAIASATGL